MNAVYESSITVYMLTVLQSIKTHSFTNFEIGLQSQHEHRKTANLIKCQVHSFLLSKCSAALNHARSYKSDLVKSLQGGKSNCLLWLYICSSINGKIWFFFFPIMIRIKNIDLSLPFPEFTWQNSNATLAHNVSSIIFQAFLVFHLMMA